MSEDWTHAGQGWQVAEIKIDAIKTMDPAQAQQVLDKVNQAIAEKKSAQEIIGTITGILGTVVGVLK